MPETQDLSDQIVRSFMTEKLQFAPTLVSSMKFANVHRLPRRTDASKISNSTSKRPPPIVAKFCAMKDKMEVGSSSATVSLRDYKTFAYFNAETKEKSSGTCECYSKQERKFNGRLLMRIIVYLRMASGKCRKRDQCPVDTTNLRTVVYNKDEACFNY